MIIIMELTLKQRYLQANAPKPPSFEEERTRNFEKLIVLISTTDRKKWISTGFNCSSLIDTYKQVYGLTSQQFETLITILTNICLKEEGLNTQTRVFILRLINTWTDLQIKITDNFKISNKKLLELLTSYANEGVDGTLRNSDAMVQEIGKFILFFSRFGEQVVEEALNLSIDNNDIRYLVIFLRSIKTQSAARRLLAELFSDNNLWDRDSYWFFILSEIIKRFPKMDYSSYYQTIMQEVIKAFTTIIDADNQDSLKKITSSDSFLQIQPALKSVALALAYLLLPQSQPQHVFIKSCVQRLINLVITSLDHINPPDYLNDLLGFIKAFVRAYLLRYRGQRGLFLLYNEDVVEDHHEVNDKNLLIDPSMEEFFDSLWDQIIPKLVYLQDSEECKPSKIIAQLCMYKPERFLQLSMQSVLQLTSREDPTLISLHGAKITLLFLQQYIIIDKPEHLSTYLQCFTNLLGFIETLGIPENLDIIELLFRTFLYLNEEQIQIPQVQNLVEDSMTLILNNLEGMSIGLEGSQNEQSELYIDLSNIFFPFILRLDQKQIKTFSQKFVYKLINQIPQHPQAYQKICVALTFINPNFAPLLIQHILKELVTSEQFGEEKEINWEFVDPVIQKLHARNEQALKWYTGILQCIFQYHPQNVLKFWPQIQKVINLLIVEWEEANYLEIALDIIYNIILCLCKPHLSYKEFVKWTNSSYKTLQLQWYHMTSEIKALIDQIYQKYFVNIETYLRKIYGEELKSNEKQSGILADFETYIEKNQNGDTMRIRKRNLKLVEYVLVPDVSDSEDSDDKKIIYRALSIQYTVLSALMLRVPFHSNLENIGDFFTEQRYANLRKRNCEYLEWVLQLLGHLNLLTQEQFTKIFNFFWRESHDQVSYTAAIAGTNQKIAPYYYPQLHRKKQLLRAPYLIVNEAYLVHMVRLEFHLMLAPTAHLNNPRYLESNFILGLNPGYEPNLHSYFPPYVEVHQYHRQLMAICRYHLDPSNPDGFLYKYLNQEDGGVKQRYNSSVKALIIGIKRLLNVFSDTCCMRDQFVRNTIFQIISLYKILPKKVDKTIIYEMIYAMLVFNFDPLVLDEGAEYSMVKYWNLRNQRSQQASSYEIISIKQTPNLHQILQQLESNEIEFLEMISMSRGLKLTRSCSFQNNTDINSQIQRAVVYLIKKIQQGLLNVQKDFNIYLLMLLLYSNSLAIDHQLIGKLLTLLFKLCQLQSLQIFDMSKTGFFHLINRFNYNKRTQKIFPNTPIRRSWSQFLKFKYLGGESQFYERIKCQKSEQNFYPSKEITAYFYQPLGSNPSKSSYKNQLLLLQILSDQEALIRFLKNCNKDPELKQTQQTNAQASVMSEDDFKTISSSAHRLMHFIWDCNPTKTPLFMSVIERYQLSPLNFYNRFFRKILRIGGQQTKQICARLAQRLREGQNEDIRLSFYISCELMLENPTHEMHQKFIQYLGTCSKQNFDFAIVGFYGVFTSNFVVAQKNYQFLIKKLRELKGAPRFRHFDILNTYMMAQGRFARAAAVEAAELLLKGINEGSDQIAEAVVSMITQCFVQAVNLKIANEWIEEPLSELIEKKKVYVLNEYVGYNDEELLIVLLTELMKKARQQQENVESTKLRIYSQIVKKILASITIYRFNNYFYKLLRQLILFVLERPQSLENDGTDQFVVAQLSDSEYPEEIYKDLIAQLLPMADRTPYVVKKKLIFLQGLIIHRSFRLNKVQIPPLLSQNEKSLTLDFIITVSTIARLMNSEELSLEVERILNLSHRKKHQTYKLIALLMASGVRQYDWKQKIIRDLIKHKKDKLVKESISEWWKGKTPETAQQLRIGELVRNFENPYSYFA